MALFSTKPQTTALPLLRDPAADFINRRLITDGSGEPVMLKGIDAVAQWARKALDIESRRFGWPAHTADYGNELGLLLGSGRDIAENRMSEMVRACLLACPYITAVDDFSFNHTGSGVQADFTVATVYGDIHAQKEVLYN